MFGKKLSPGEQQEVDGLYHILDVYRSGLTEQITELIESNRTMLLVSQDANKGRLSPGAWSTAITPTSIEKVSTDIQRVRESAMDFHGEIERYGAPDYFPKKVRKASEDTLQTLGAVNNYLGMAVEGLSEPNPLVNSELGYKLNQFVQGVGIASRMVNLLTPLKH